MFHSEFVNQRIFAFSFCVAFFLGNFLPEGHSQTESSVLQERAFQVKRVFAKALRDQEGVLLLQELTQDIGARPAGSDNYDKAADWAIDQLNRLGLKTTRQAVNVKAWQRGKPAVATAYFASSRKALRCTSLGNSPTTGPRGIRGELVELRSLEAVDSIGEGLNGKIAFFNRPFDASRVNTFAGYGGAVDQRVYGAARAAKYGAIGAVVRSMTPNLDAVPHTGTTVFPDPEAKIPVIAVATLDAERLHRELQSDSSSVEVFFQSNGKELLGKKDDNVIADWNGSAAPEKIILIGAHLDSWDLGEGAHDDGAGVGHVLEAVNLLKAIDYKPLHTIRVVLFANEENGIDGGRAYWNLSDSLSLKHIAALESDSGGFIPRAFSVSAPEGKDEATGKLTKRWAPLLEPYGITFMKGGGGADISGLKAQGATLFGLRTDGQRYFDLHHTDLDRFNMVHPREFEMGAAAIATLVMMIDADM